MPLLDAVIREAQSEQCATECARPFAMLEAVIVASDVMRRRDIDGRKEAVLEWTISTCSAIPVSEDLNPSFQRHTQTTVVVHNI